MKKEQTQKPNKCFEGKGPFEEGLENVAKLKEAMKQRFCKVEIPEHPAQAWEKGFVDGANIQKELEAKYREDNNICCMPFDDIDAARVAAYEQGKMDMKKQFEKERLKYCDELTAEQAQIESNFVKQHLKNNNRTPTFIDAIEYGKDLQKQQMMKGAVEAKVSAEAKTAPSK